MCRIGIAFKYVSPILSRTAFANFDYAVVLGNEDVRDDSTAYRTTFMPHAGGHRRFRLAIRASHLVFGLERTPELSAFLGMSGLAYHVPAYRRLRNPVVANDGHQALARSVVLTQRSELFIGQTLRTTQLFPVGPCLFQTCPGRPPYGLALLAGHVGGHAGQQVSDEGLGRVEVRGPLALVLRQ